MATAANARMASVIDSYENIATLEQINGISIGEIEKRARPGQYARSGFIGPTENLKDVLQADWRTVQALGTTHIELALHLREIWKIVETSKDGPYFAYRVSQLPNNSLEEGQSLKEDDSINRKFFFVFGIIAALGAVVAAAFISSFFLLALIPAAGSIYYGTSKNYVKQAGQALTGEIEISRGMQEDLFGFDATEANNCGWNRELRVTNLSNNLSLTIGEGVISYIEKYGFYEGGGEQNNYRVDPIKLVAILTGASLTSLQSRVKQIKN